jgi:hypothetical protein
MENIENIDPGLAVRVAALKSGKISIDTPLGRVTGREFEKAVKQLGVTMRPGEYINALAANGVDLSKEVRKRAFGSVGKALKGGDPITAGRIALDRASDVFENSYREQVFLSNLERGLSFQDAARITGETLLNYRDLSPNEKSLFNRFYLFYGWVSKSTKKTLNSLFFRQKDLQKQIKGAQGLAETFSSKDALPSVDDYELDLVRSKVAKEQISFPLGRTPSGDPIIGRGFGLPLNTILQQFKLSIPRNASPVEIIDSFLDDAARTSQKQFASANPFIKGVVEGTTQKSLYFDRPLNAKFLRRLPSIADNGEKVAKFPFNKIPEALVDEPLKLFLQAVPDGKGNLVADPGLFYLATNFIPGFSRAITTARSLTDPRLPGVQTALRNLTGVRIETGRPSQTFAFEQEKALRELIVDRNVKELIRERQGQ